MSVTTTVIYLLEIAHLHMHLLETKQKKRSYLRSSWCCTKYTPPTHSCVTVLVFVSEEHPASTMHSLLSANKLVQICSNCAFCEYGKVKFSSM